MHAHSMCYVVVLLINRALPRVTVPMKNHECYQKCNELQQLSVEALQSNGFKVKKMVREWTDDEKGRLAMGVRAYGNAEAMAAYGESNTAKKDDLYIWLAHHCLDNDRTPAQCQYAVKHLKNKAPF
jgi:hypothetical protein